MKIEVAPWIRENVTTMDELYTGLTLEKLEDKLHEDGNKKLENYNELFSATEKETLSKINSRKRRFHKVIPCFKKRLTDENEYIEMETVANTGKRILLKGKPGMVKSTLIRKMSRDWAKKEFKTFYIVFFVFLKLVRPDEAIENIIIQQTPVLEDLRIFTQQLGMILEKFGNRTLLILDGLDEHALGQNQDVLKNC